MPDINEDLPTGALALAAIGAAVGAVLGYIAEGFYVASAFAIIGAVIGGLVGQRADRASRS
jgi:hypothetical protein